MTTQVPYRPLPVDQADVSDEYGPDSSVQPWVHPGETTEFEWLESLVYPGTSRKVWVHVPDQYDPAEPAALMVFQDGWWYLDPQGAVHAGVVLDNLIDRGDIPVTIGVFVDPGVFPGVADPSERKNRNAEYDAVDDRYVTFLVSEILPRVAQTYSISENPDQWAICGGSSGGNCAFTAAWLRPDRFRRVIAFLSSFVQMPGGDPYPRLIADTTRQPLRIFLQAAHRDAGWNDPQMNWLASNLRVSGALAEASYDFEGHVNERLTTSHHELDRGESCLIITGTPGAGKSTVARLVAHAITRSALLGGDQVTRLVVSGGVWALGEPADEASAQVLLANKNLCALRKSSSSSMTTTSSSRP